MGRGLKGERFAKLPVELLKDPAVTTLPHAAFRVLAIFAAGYNGANNGTLACTDSWMKQFGIVSRDTTYASIAVLLERGLIEVTRPGIKHRKVPTLYAITWQPVHNRHGELLGRFTPPTHAYKQWNPPQRTKKKVPDRRKNRPADTTEVESDGRTSLSPIVGQEKGDFSPTSQTEVGGFQSDGREYSENLGTIPDPPSRAAHPPSPEPVRVSRQLRVRLRRKSPTEIIVELLREGWTHDQVHTFAARSKMSITLDDIRAIGARAHT